MIIDMTLIFLMVGRRHPLLVFQEIIVETKMYPSASNDLINITDLIKIT